VFHTPLQLLFQIFFKSGKYFVNYARNAARGASMSSCEVVRSEIYSYKLNGLIFA